MTKEMLARRSYEVLTAESARVALETLRTHGPVDLMISEAHLPGESGADLIRAVRSSFPSTAVMYLTAYTEQPLDPVIPYLLKPLTTDALIRRVHQVLEKSREARQGLSRTKHQSRETVERSAMLQSETATVLSRVQENVDRLRRLRSDWLTQQSSQHRPIILVVEDDAALCYAVSRFLTAQGFTVLDATTHNDALCLWRDHHECIDAVVTDLHGVDGLALAEAVQSDCPHEPILFMTRAPNAFPCPTLRKPFELEDLLAAIRQMLAPRRTG